MTEARLSPDGFVAQLLTFPDGEQRWVLSYVDEHAGFTVRILDDGEADDWPRLAVTE